MRIRKKSVHKKRWAKRESSSSNPTIFKYRKSIGVQPVSYASTASLANLPLQSKSNLENDLCDSLDNLSVLSDKFLFGATNSQLEKDAGAVFAAITEIIRSQGGKETVTEYIAAMMTYLETVEDDNELNCSMYLISKIINRVPAAVLNVQFSKISSILMKIISTNADTTNVLLLQNTLRSLSVVMQGQEMAVWNNLIATHIFRTILSFSIDSRPQVREAAQAAIRLLVKQGINKLENIDDNKSKYHPTCDLTAQFCLEQLNQYGGSKDQTSILHTIGLARHTLEFLSPHRVKSICESLLQLMTIGNTILKTCCLQTLRYFLVSRPKSETLPAPLAAKLITALYNYKPSANDVVLWKLWLPVMQEAHYHLNTLDEYLCFQHLPFLFENAVNAWTSDSLEIHGVVSACLKGILHNIIEPVKKELLIAGDVLNSVKKCFELVEGALRFQYQASWNQVLSVLSVFYEVSGLEGYAFMMDSLKTLATLCENEDFRCIDEAKYAIGAAVRSMGPQKVLKAIPLELEISRIAFRHGWIISVLQQNIRHADFSYFVTNLIPLTQQLQQKAANAAENGKQINEKALIDMETQVWSLLPGFCTKPSNVFQNFKQVAKLFGSLISTRSNVRLNILSGIRTLINQEDDDINLELARFSKNFLPIFLNLYTSQLADDLTLGERLAVYETLKVYLKITDSKIVESIYEKVKSKFLDDIESKTRHALLDLFLVLVSCLNLRQIKSTYDLLSEYITSTDATIRKKVFRFLEELCSCDSESCKKFVERSLSELQSVLGMKLSSAPPATKAVRLRCLKNLISRFSGKKKNFVVKLLPETILCIKEPSAKAHSSALALLTEIGNYFMKISESSSNDGLKEFIQLVVAGFAGSPMMIDASILAVAHIIREFREQIIEDKDLEPLIESACSLIKYPNRQVVDSALALLKSILASFSEEDLLVFSEKIVNCLTTMPDEIKRPFRFKTKEVLIKLVKKFGYLRVTKLAPESLHRIIKKINKDLIREKRNKSDKNSKSERSEPLKGAKSRDNLVETEDEDEDEANEDATENNKHKSNKLWLREQGDDGVINFLDPSAFKNISATKQSTNAKSKNKSHDFRISEDGKLIIVDDEESTADPPNCKKNSLKRKREDDDDRMSDNDIIDEAVSDDDNENPKAYKPGGSGIHRSLKPQKGTMKKPSSKVRKTEFKKPGNKSGKSTNVQPFKYMPLGTLKNRKRTNNLDNIVRSAKKGSKAGRVKNAQQKRKKTH